MNPSLLDRAKSITNVICDDDNSNDVSDEITEIVIEDVDTARILPTGLWLSDLEYVEVLSSINIVANERLASNPSKGIPDRYRGNGRDEPRLFTYNCSKTPGCSYSSTRTQLLKTHEARCSADKLATALAADNQFSCDVEGCSSCFQSAVALKFHQDNQHSYIARACQLPGCDPEKLYVSRGEMRKHQREKHSPWTPKKCPVDTCSLSIKFKDAQALKVHLQTIHNIQDTTFLRQQTYVRTPSFIRQSCTYPKCYYPILFKEKRAYVKHLLNKHDVPITGSAEYIALE